MNNNNYQYQIESLFSDKKLIFSRKIIDMVEDYGISYLEAIDTIIEKESLDPDSVASLLTEKVLIGIEKDAEELRLITRKNKKSLL